MNNNKVKTISIVAQFGNPGPPQRMTAEQYCYCGAKMVQIQTCKFQCMNCGALLDCEDVSGLPK